MTVVYVTRKDNFPEAHIFEDFADALTYAALTYDEEFIQSILFIYENNMEVDSK